MKLVDYHKLVLDRSNDFLTDNMLGIIVKTADELGENTYGVYVPKIMMAVDNGNAPVEKEISFSESRCLNSTNSKFATNTVLSANYIKMTMDRVYNLSMPKFVVGEEVTVGIIDQDIKSLYIKPFCRDSVKNRPWDTMQMYVPASGNHDGKDLTDDNTYFVRCDSENKFVKIHMSNANGEVSAYDICMDGNAGSITLTDGKRSIILNTNSDEISLTTADAASVISMKGDAIDVNCSKFYLNAKDSIEFETPKGTFTIDNNTVKSKKYLGELDSMTIKGDKQVEEFTKVDITNKKRTTTCPVSIYDGILGVTGVVTPGGIAFGGACGVKPTPIQPQISEKGFSNFKGIGGMPLVKGTPLVNLLTIMATQLDAVAAAPIVPIPPMASASLASFATQLISVNVKG